MELYQTPTLTPTFETKLNSANYETRNKHEHAAHTPRKRWRCGSACAARDKNTNDPNNKQQYLEKNAF